VSLRVKFVVPGNMELFLVSNSPSALFLVARPLTLSAFILVFLVGRTISPILRPASSLFFATQVLRNGVSDLLRALNTTCAFYEASAGDTMAAYRAWSIAFLVVSIAVVAMVLAFVVHPRVREIQVYRAPAMMMKPLLLVLLVGIRDGGSNHTTNDQKYMYSHWQHFFNCLREKCEIF
jgi:hypothetical protein